MRHSVGQEAKPNFTLVFLYHWRGTHNKQTEVMLDQKFQTICTGPKCKTLKPYRNTTGKFVDKCLLDHRAGYLAKGGSEGLE